MYTPMHNKRTCERTNKEEALEETQNIQHEEMIRKSKGRIMV